ncbi:MAG: hypothetical protein EON95_16985 [Caulobacteraceae bacterium]|nr:MAG: hypothetical protein EON95_16985 [Caulobacteraceae bacterium]
MTDEQFLTLDKLAARSHAEGQAPVEQLRLMALYKTRHGVDLATVELETSDVNASSVVGWVLICTGVALSVWAFNYDVGVSTGAGGLYGLPTEVANTDAMEVRLMVLVSGATLFLSGVIALAAAQVANAIAGKAP